MELAGRTGLARSTVSKTVDLLTDIGLVRAVSVGPSQGGRRPLLVEFQDAAFGVAGVHLGFTDVAVALTDLRAKAIAFERHAHPVPSDASGAMALAVELLERCLRCWNLPPERLVGVGVAAPCPVQSAAEGPSLSTRYLPDSNERPRL